MFEFEPPYHTPHGDSPAPRAGRCINLLITFLNPHFYMNLLSKKTAALKLVDAGIVNPTANTVLIEPTIAEIESLEEYTSKNTQNRSVRACVIIGGRKVLIYGMLASDLAYTIARLSDEMAERMTVAVLQNNKPPLFYETRQQAQAHIDGLKPVPVGKASDQPTLADV